jgi:hypothetical protein
MKSLIILTLVLGFSSTLFSQAQDWQAVEKVFGKKGTQQGDMFKMAFPRSDLRVNVGEVAVEPALALTSWMAFKPMEHDVMIMGDMVLLDSEIAPAMQKLIASGLEVSALHNHIVGETPAIKYMHFGGHGDAVKLAEAMKSVLALTGTPMTPAPPPPQTAVDWSSVESVLGATGQRKGNVVQFSIPRAETISENGMDIPPFMGMATAINIQSVGEKAATTGDFVLLASEVNPVVKALTENGIAVTAIHNHMLFESPRLFFVHYWGVNVPAVLAKGLRAALDKTNSQKKK